jgi:PilZ domain-containing protein
MDERRKNQRFQVEVPVRLTSGGASFPAHLRDVCRDAVLVETHRALTVDTQVAVAMALPGTGGPLEVGGRVIRVTPGDGDAQRVAILFTSVTPAAETRIDFFIAQHEK